MHITNGIIGADKGRAKCRETDPLNMLTNNSYVELKQYLVRSRGASGVSYV